MILLVDLILQLLWYIIWDLIWLFNKIVPTIHGLTSVLLKKMMKFERKKPQSYNKLLGRVI